MNKSKYLLWLGIGMFLVGVAAMAPSEGAIDFVAGVVKWSGAMMVGIHIGRVQEHQAHSAGGNW